MAVVKALELAVALIALVTLPCAIAAMICADELINSIRRSVRRRRDHWAEQRILHQMERSLTPARPFLAPVTNLFAPVSALLAVGGPTTTEATPVDQPPFERVAADLRRLGADRLGIGQRNELWHTAVERAYDHKLHEACRSLGIAEHLEELSGMDRAIERLRVEGELISAGVRLR